MLGLILTILVVGLIAGAPARLLARRSVRS
jgi:hypothetical protein